MFTKEEISLIATALDCYTRTICQRIVTSQAAGLELQNNLEVYKDINSLFISLDEKLKDINKIEGEKQ